VSTASLSEYGRRLAQQARRIGKSPSMLYRMIHQHGLPAMLVGGTWFIKDEDVDKFFRERTAARLGKPAPIDSKAHDATDRALTAAGW
jgi:excisionase family DNA binding protein